jgi:hypothetical protein
MKQGVIKSTKRFFEYHLVIGGVGICAIDEEAVWHANGLPY